MKGIFGLVAVLIVLATVALVASRQLKAVRGGEAAIVSPMATSGPATQGAPRRVQDQVRSDIDKAVEQSTRRIEAEQ